MESSMRVRSEWRRVDEMEDRVVERGLIQVAGEPGGILALLPPEAHNLSHKRRVAHGEEARVGVRDGAGVEAARDDHMAVVRNLAE